MSNESRNSSSFRIRGVILSLKVPDVKDSPPKIISESRLLIEFLIFVFTFSIKLVLSNTFFLEKNRFRED